MLREQRAQEQLRLQQRKQELALQTEIEEEAEKGAIAEAEAGISERGAKEGFRKSAPAVKDAIKLPSFSALSTTCKNTLHEIGYLRKIENLDSLKNVVTRLPSVYDRNGVRLQIK